jgi:hypothetical protein
MYGVLTWFLRQRFGKEHCGECRGSASNHAQQGSALARPDFKIIIRQGTFPCTGHDLLDHFDKFSQRQA